MPDQPVRHTKNFVLEHFSKAEGTEVEKILETSANAIRTVLRDGIDKAMAEFN